MALAFTWWVYRATQNGKFAQDWALPKGLDGRTVGWRVNVDRGNKRRVTVAEERLEEGATPLKNSVRVRHAG